MHEFEGWMWIGEKENKRKAKGKSVRKESIFWKWKDEIKIKYIKDNSKIREHDYGEEEKNVK